MSIFQQDTEFYDLLEQQSGAALRAAREIFDLCGDFSNAPALIGKIKDIEVSADKITHDLIGRTDSRFITPYDKEDLHRLSVTLDDLTDFVEAAAARIVIYHIPAARPDFQQMVGGIVKAMEATHAAVCELRCLKNHSNIQQMIITIHSAEEQGDVLYRKALESLFGEPGINPLDVIKWKELYDRIEMTSDRCQDVADMLETIAVKYG